MWEAVRLTINDVPVTQSGGLYPYKAYISTLLSYDPWVKGCQLSCQGWYSDSSGHMDAADNDGFSQRCALFREDFNLSNKYRSDGAQFFTRLHHDLITCESGLPPGKQIKHLNIEYKLYGKYLLYFSHLGTKFSLDLDRAKDSFVIIKEENDETIYRLKLLSLALYLPVAQLSQTVYSEINSLLTKRDKPVGIQYRNIEIRPYTISKGTHNFYSELLFTENVPCRLIVVFVESGSKQGDFKRSPFNFKRRWTVPKLSSKDTENEPDDQTTLFEEKLRQVEEQHNVRLKQVEDLNQKLFESLKSLQDTLSKVVGVPLPGKGKGRGKNRTAPPSTSSTCASLTGNLEDVHLCEAASVCSNQSQRDIQSQSTAIWASERNDLNRDTAPNIRNKRTIHGETKELYITKLELQINGTSIDQVFFL